MPIVGHHASCEPSFVIFLNRLLSQSLRGVLPAEIIVSQVVRALVAIGNIAAQNSLRWERGSRSQAKLYRFVRLVLLSTLALKNEAHTHLAVMKVG